MTKHSSTTKCVVCGEDAYISGWYMVKDKVWREAGFKPNQSAHALCLAYRLKRRLARDDFTDSPMNDLVFAILDKGKIRTFGELYDKL